MEDVRVATHSGTMRRIAETSATKSSLTTKLPTITKPSGDGVFTILNAPSEGMMASAVKIIPYGAGSDGNTFLFDVYGWVRTVEEGLSGKTLWVPILLASFTTATLESTLPGVANGYLGTAALFCSTITQTVGNPGISSETIAPGSTANRVVSIVIDTKGCPLIEIDFSTNSSATSANALIGVM